MIKLVNKDTNKINYGIHDTKIDFNWKDYVLHNFWDKKVNQFKHKLAFHKFHFVSFTSQDYIIGLAIIDVSIAKNIFGYVYKKDKGIITQWQKTISNRHIKFTNDIDHNQIQYHSKKMSLSIEKNIDTTNVVGHFNFKNIISLDYQFNLGLEHKSLRVVNPINFDNWSFTEKRAGLKLTNIKAVVNNEIIDLKANSTLATIDWSAGFFRRNTVWAWSSGATFINKSNVGFNFTIFHNNALYPENAIWVNNKREYVRDILFSWDYNDPYHHKMEIYTPDHRIHIYFETVAQKSDVHCRGLGLIKTNFHQYLGFYSGHISFNKKKIVIPKFLGLLELHKALW